MKEVELLEANPDPKKNDNHTEADGEEISRRSSYYADTETNRASTEIEECPGIKSCQRDNLAIENLWFNMDGAPSHSTLEGHYSFSWNFFLNTHKILKLY